MSRLIVVSNRVAPVTEGKSSSGGLVVGVLDALRDTGGVWLGWSGDIDPSPSPNPHIQRVENIDFATLDLTEKEYDRYYRGFSNGVLWPVFHYRVDLSAYQEEDYAGYLRVNRRFATVLADLAQPDDLIWVHDYHLLPLGRAARDAGLPNRMGFFLHIPFPTSPVLRAIPPHRALVEAMCAYDLLGFQTDEDAHAFTDYATRYLGATPHPGGIHIGGRFVRIDAYPIGIHPEQVRALSKESRRSRLLDALKAGIGDRKLVVSVDRLDYSKGLVERFESFDCLFEMMPSHRGQVQFVQIAPPSRQDVHGYRQIRRQLESTAGRINGKWSELSWIPIRYMNRSYDRGVLMTFFRASQVGLVTPMRDGMNLVAKEYVASQPAHDPGVLVLSEFAGAAAELGKAAVMVNPYDTRGMARALDLALRMPFKERKTRYETLMEVLRANDLSCWRDRFLDDLARASIGTERESAPTSPLA